MRSLTRLPGSRGTLVALHQEESSDAPPPDEAAVLASLHELFAGSSTLPDSALLREAPVAIYSADMTGRILSWNHAAERMLNWPASEMIGRFVPFLAEDEMTRAHAAFDDLVEGRSVPALQHQLVRRDGSRVDALTSASVLMDADGKPFVIVAFSVDISVQRRAAEAIEEAEHRWRTLLESTNDTVTMLDEQGMVRSSTGEFTDVLGYESESWNGRSGFDLIHPDDRPMAEELFAWVLDHPGQPISDVFRTLHSNGRWELIEYTVVNKLDDPLVAGVVVTTHNVTEVKLAEALVSDEAGVLELIARAAPLDSVLDEILRMVEFHTGGRCGIFLLPAVAPDGGSVTAAPDVITMLDRAAEIGFTGPCRAAMTQRETVVMADLTDPAACGGDPTAFLEAGIGSAWSHPITETDDHEVLGTIAVYNAEPREPAPRELEVVAAASHLTAIALERHRVQRRLEHRARHDQLTGLPNRWAIIERLDASLTALPDSATRVAVLLIDLDRFKVVNDSLGHGAGDALLVAFGDRLRSLAHADFFVGHFGADEFVVVLDHVTDVDDVYRVASRLDLALSEPFTITVDGVTGDHPIYLSTSVGVALGTRSSSGQQLLQQADTAMFRAKDRGRDRLEVFDDAMQARAAEQLRVDRDLRLAVERAELRLHYQPKVELATGRMVGVEALLRWEHPERGLVEPAEFIALAEETGLIVRIGAWVLDEAVRQAKTWVERNHALETFSVAVNLSARQLTAQGLVETVARILDRYHWPPRQLTLELTESILIEDADAALGVLRQLKGLGVRLAIDDFGTGYSSLGYLHRFPFDIVKVDRQFVVPLDADGSGSALATAVMHMARALGLATVAEGVEEPHQLAGVRALGCDQAQGFFFAEALPAPELNALLASNPRW
jgi:diguanylate cyclase (GGDEF)-like protein/PAS domain S-box-containing protein